MQVVFCRGFVPLGCNSYAQTKFFIDMKKLYFLLSMLMLLAISIPTAWAADTYEKLTSIADIDENADYVLGIDGTGFHYEGTSSWGKTALPSAQTPIAYKLKKASDGKSFTAKATISGTAYYLQVPTSNTFSMATSAGTNTDLVIGTTQVSSTNYAVANKTTTARHIRLNGTSGLRSYAGTTGNMAFFYKVVNNDTSGDQPGGDSGQGGDNPSDDIVDELSRETTGITGTNYSDWSGKKAISDAVYAGNSAGGNSSIQLRSTNNNSGVVTTASGGKVKSISVTWNSNTSSGRTLNVYGNTSAYNSAADLYNAQTQGALLGTIVCGTSTSLDITQDCEYIGFRSASGAMYLTDVTITWEAGSASDKEDVPEDKLKWSNTSATVTKDAGDNVFPTLTNSLPLSVTYESSNTNVATITNAGAVTIVSAGTTTIKAIFSGNDTYKAKTVSYELTVNPPAATPIEGGVIDVLSSTWSGKTTSSYGDIDLAAPTSTAHYKGNCAGQNNTVQLRSSNNAGIVSTASAGKVKRVEVVWNSSTTSGRTLNVYASNTAYTNVADLYESNLVPIGTIVYGTSTYVDIEGDYIYVGLRSANGAMYFDEIRITWLPTLSAVTVDNGILNGSVAVSGATNLSAVAVGTELTLSSEPASGYKLASYDVYKTGDFSTKVTVENNKFIMPDFGVTVSATFEPLKTLTSIEITTPANQTTFWKGETFNYDGLVVTAHFDGANDEVITPVVSGSTASAGTPTVTVSYTEGTTKTVTYSITVRNTENTEATPFTVAEARDIIDKLQTASNVYATGIVSEIVTAYNAQYGNISYNISVDGLTTSDQLQAYRGFDKEGAHFTSADDVQVGDEVIIYGNLKKYNETYEFDQNNQRVSFSRTKTAAGLAYTTASVEKHIGDANFTNVLSNPNELSGISYASSNTSVADVDAITGEVTIKAIGATTITATFAGNASYLYGEASYTLTVNDPSLTKVTFDATIDKGESPLSKSNITLSCSNGILNNESEYRLYKNSTTTFACSAGNITMIEFIGVSGKPASGFAAPDEGNFVTDGNNATWTGNAASIAFIASNEQVRATKIFVSYKEDSRAEAGLEYEMEEVEKVVGDEPFTNALTNPNSLNVSFSSSDETIAEVAANGQVTIKAVGTTTISAVFEGNETYKPATVSYTLTVATPVAPFDGDYFVKVTSANDLASGEYLIVYGDGSLAFNSALETLDAVGNTISVVFDHGKIQGTNEVLAAVFTIDASAGTIQSASGMYIGQTSDANGLAASAETTHTNTISFDEEGNANIISSGGAYLRYNSASNQTRFRYYKSSSYTSQQAIQLYKKESVEPVEPELTYENARTGLTIGKFYTICMPQNILGVRGATFWNLNNRDENGSMVYFVEAEAPFDAGKPYIFIATAETLEVAYGEENAGSPVANGALHGTFSAMTQDDFNDVSTANGNSPIYMLVNNQLRQVAWRTGNSLGANRAYVIYNELQAGEPTPAPGRRVLAMPMNENVATGIDALGSDAQPSKIIVNGQLFIIRDGKAYDATGRQVSKF